MAKRKSEQEAANGEVVVQLATRVPKALYRELKLYSVTESKSISELVTTFVREGLADVQKPRARKRKGRESEEEAA